LTNSFALDILASMANEETATARQPLPRRLFEPVSVGRYELRNRIVMAPLTRCRVTEPNVPNALMVEYYEQRSGAGLIISEATGISEGAQGYWRTPGIYTLEQVSRWQTVTDAVHAGGGRMFIQLWHNGRMLHPDNVPWIGRSVAPSAIAPQALMMTPKGRQAPPTPHALTRAEIRGIESDFALAARNAMLAGADGVELHAANGYIFEQFLHRNSNQRNDAYGGDIANRARFLLEVVEEVAVMIGPDRLGVRISPFGILNDMQDLEPGEIFHHVLAALDPFDLAYLHIIRPAVSGNQDSDAGRALRDPVLDVREFYRGPVIVAGGVDVAEGDALIDRGLADAIAFGRWFVSNPDLPERLQRRSPIAEADRETFYTQGREGYVDYPTHSASARFRS
jgi:N-ethylmaleimide reductase